MRIAALLGPLVLVACGLDRRGLGTVPPADGGDDAFAVMPDAADESGGDANGESDAQAAADTPDEDAPDDSNASDASEDAVPLDAGVPCEGSPTSCGAPGHCADCSSSPDGPQCLADGTCGCIADGDCHNSSQGSVCVNGACGCNKNGDCNTGKCTKNRCG